MKSLISLFIFIAIALWICRIYLTNDRRFRYVEYNRKEYYLLSRNMYFTIFTVCTAPFFLTPYALLKYSLWFVCIFLLVFTNKVRMRLETVMTLYLIFFFWLCLTMTWTTTPRDGYMMLIKYFIPILFLWLGYSSLRNEKDLVVFLKVVNWVACVFCFFIGGFAGKFLPPIYSFFMNICTTYAGFSCFLISVFIVPILLYMLTKDKKYIYCALWMLLSPVLQSVRTGIGGMFLVFVVAIYLRYKQRSLPALCFAGAMFLSIVLFVPGVNEKFFGERAGKVTGTDIVSGNAMSLDNIEMSGREYMWERVKENCYYGNEVFGGGLGTSGRYVKNYGKATQGLQMMHNDYLQIICDTGLVGIFLLTVFYVAFILKVFAHVVLRRSAVLVRLTGIMALSSMVGIGFAMYFDNVVSNSMQALVMPFIYWGFFFKALDIEGKDKRTLAILRFRKERE